MKVIKDDRGRGYLLVTDSGYVIGLYETKGEALSEKKNY